MADVNVNQDGIVGQWWWRSDWSVYIERVKSDTRHPRTAYPGSIRVLDNWWISRVPHSMEADKVQSNSPPTFHLLSSFDSINWLGSHTRLQQRVPRFGATVSLDGQQNKKTFKVYQSESFFFLLYSSLMEFERDRFIFIRSIVRWCTAPPSVFALFSTVYGFRLDKRAVAGAADATRLV